jgi:hypothetical protein
MRRTATKHAALIPCPLLEPCLTPSPCCVTSLGRAGTHACHRLIAMRPGKQRVANREAVSQARYTSAVSNAGGIPSFIKLPWRRTQCKCSDPTHLGLVETSSGTTGAIRSGKGSCHDTGAMPGAQIPMTFQSGHIPCPKRATKQSLIRQQARYGVGSRSVVLPSCTGRFRMIVMSRYTRSSIV